MNEAISKQGALVLMARGLAKTYGQGPTAVEVLRAIDLDVMPSEKVAIVGSFGSGKSSLLHLLGGLDTPSAGSVVLAGSNLNQLSVKKLDQLRNHSLGLFYQFHHLLAEFSAVENVALPLRIRGLDNDESMDRASKILKAVGLAARELHTPGELSGGERQRVAVARALVGNPWFFTGERKVIDQALLQTVVDHISLSKEFYGEDKGYKMMKKHLIYYAKNMYDVTCVDRRTYYDAVCRAGSIKAQIALVKDFFGMIMDQEQGQ